MDRMDQADWPTFAAGRVAMPANCPRAVSPSEPRAAGALMASSARRNGSADSDDARPGTDDRRDQPAVTITGRVIPAYGSMEHRRLVTTSC